MYIQLRGLTIILVICRAEERQNRFWGSDLPWQRRECGRHGKRSASRPAHDDHLGSIRGKTGPFRESK